MRVKLEIAEALKKILPAVDKDGVLMIQVQGGKLMLQASDGRCAATTVIACKNGEDAQIFISYSALNGVINEFLRLPCADDYITMEIGNTLRLKRADAKVELPLMTQNDYKPIIPPTHPENVRSCVIEGHCLKKALLTINKSPSLLKNEFAESVFFRFTPDYFEAGAADPAQATLLFQCGIKDGSGLKFKADEPFFDVALYTTRGKSLIPILDDDVDVEMGIYDSCIMLKYGTTMVVVPKSADANGWNMHDSLKNMMDTVIKQGGVYRMERKAFLSALSLISCNLQKNDTNSWKFELSYEKDNLIFRNTYGTAEIKVPVIMDGSFDENVCFSIERIKTILNGLEDENVLFSIGEAQPGYTAICFVEKNERTLLLGVGNNANNKPTNKIED